MIYVNNFSNIDELSGTTYDTTSKVSSANQLQTADSTTITSFAEAMKVQSDNRANASMTLDEIFQKAADTYGVDVNLLKAIAKQESNFQADAVSHCGAQGIMQLMPATAKALGVKDAFDPEQNIMGGAKLMSQLLDRYDGDLKLALAGYNAGIGNVAKYGGVPPFKETQNYIKKVLGYYNEGVNTPNHTYDTAEDTNTTAKKEPASTHIAVVATSDTPEFVAPTHVEQASSSDSIFDYQDYLKFVELYMKYFMDTNL